MLVSVDKCPFLFSKISNHTDFLYLTSYQKPETSNQQPVSSSQYLSVSRHRRIRLWRRGEASLVYIEPK